MSIYGGIRTFAQSLSQLEHYKRTKEVFLQVLNAFMKSRRELDKGSIASRIGWMTK